MTSHRNLIAGEWIAGNPSPNINPSNTADVIGHYDQADREQAAAAIAAARQALPGWALSGIAERAEILDRVGREIAARREELATLLAREEGKTLPEARGEVTRAEVVPQFEFTSAGRCSGW